MDTTLQFILITLLLEITPGPGVLFVLFQSAHGFRYALAGIMGLLTANLIWISLVATGLGLILTQSPVVFEAVRWCGGAYLTYLGYKILRYGVSPVRSIEGLKDKRFAHVYVQGMLTSLSNPKALLFFMALFPNFTRPEYFVVDILYFGAIKMSMLFIVMSTYALLGQRIFDILQFSRLAQIASRAFGGGIIIAAIAVVRS